ncbi:beta-1,3-glucan-binding protein-like isoform X2 [Zootermopsis nevadensis]|nr:beta-1,3-glucan-binding protein-like isoform X2 [Zootermopsis nevadensis]
MTDLTWTATGMACTDNNVNATLHCKISASKIPNRNTCSGQLLFEDDFDVFDLERWHHEVSASGGRHNEFQVFVNNRSNSFVRGGKLHLRATLTRDVLGEEVLYNGILDLRGSALSGEECTNPANNGCYKQALGAQILNPVMSAQLQTSGSFTFQYGIVKMRAKMPRGDWLWPAIYLLPHRSAYGPWPNSGQMTIAQSRGNAMYLVDGEPMGTQRMEMALHFGPGIGGFIKQHINSKEEKGWDNDFHEYELEWTPEHIKFSVDEKSVLNIIPPLDGGFWMAGGFSKDFADNIYHSGSRMAPFDQQFYLVISLAVGGLSDFFLDSADYKPFPKPWNNTSPTATLDFWERKDEWYPSWQEGSDMQVDYVRVWALP